VPLRLLRNLLLALLAPPLAYLAAMVLLGLMPANAGWVEADEGVVVFVNTNGVHTGIGMPVANEVMDWRPFMPAAHLKAPIEADYLFVGYGHRAFYLETESWADLSLSLAANAAFGGGATLVHVDHVRSPGEGPEQRAVTLSREEYRRLVAFVRKRFALDGAGRTIPLIGRGYGEHDMFYEAVGGYSLWLTCNEWTGRALRAAGVRMGFWTPLEQAVMWRLP
jgi:uncharacterized protein (TIGR02117 family)